MALLTVRDLFFRVGKKAILDGVSFQLHRGEYVTLVGPNGAGKSTFLRCVALIHRSWEGEILWGGLSVRSLKQRDWTKHVAYLPQEERVDIPYTVEEFVLMARYPHGNPFSPPSRKDLDAVEEALSLTGMWPFRHRVVRTLSGGERQRAMLAAVLAQQTPVLLLDEATTFLDFRHQEEVQQLLHKINCERQVTVVAVTHDINAAAVFSQRVVALRNGRIVFDGSPKALMDKGVLREIFGIHPVLVPHPQLGIPMILPTPSGGEA